MRIDAPFTFELEPSQSLAGFGQCHGTEFAELDLAQRAIAGPVAVEKHSGGIRAAHPQSRVIEIGALVTSTHVGDNARGEHWGRFFHFAIFLISN